MTVQGLETRRREQIWKDDHQDTMFIMDGVRILRDS